MVTRTSIQEANRHLHAMHQRIMSLETTVQHQNQTLLERDTIFQRQIGELVSNKDGAIQEMEQKIRELSHALEEKSQLVAHLENQLQQKNNLLFQYSTKLQQVSQLTPLLPGLQTLIDTVSSVGQYYETECHLDNEDSSCVVINEQEGHIPLPEIPKGKEVKPLSDLQPADEFPTLEEMDTISGKNSRKSLLLNGDVKSKEFYL